MILLMFLISVFFCQDTSVAMYSKEVTTHVSLVTARVIGNGKDASLCIFQDGQLLYDHNLEN